MVDDSIIIPMTFNRNIYMRYPRCLIYQMMIPRRLKYGLLSDNWISAFGRLRNKSQTMGELRTGVQRGLDELILLAEKMPRDKLIEAIPPKKLLQIVHNYLYNDPHEDQLHSQQFTQSELVSKIENERKDEDEGEDHDTIADIKARLQREFRKMVDARSKKSGDVSSDQQAKIRIEVERSVWSIADVDKLKLLEREKDAFLHLEKKYAEYLRAVDNIRTRLAGDIAKEGVEYCSRQVAKVLEPTLARRVEEPLADAIELLEFIPDKVASHNNLDQAGKGSDYA